MFGASSPTSGGVTLLSRKFDFYPVFVAIFVLLLVGSIHGVRWLPFYSYPGLDLQNLFVFHHQCPGWPIPYTESGAACGDPLERAMVYPPLAYWTMSWVRLFNFPTATLLWSVVVIGFTALGMGLATCFEKTRRIGIMFIGLLLFFQMPMLYAIERGNIDALVIPLFMGGSYFLSMRRGFLAGLLFATASWMKVYPVIPSAMVMAGFFLDRDLRKTAFPGLLKGFIVGGTVWALLLFPDSYRYIADVLPRFATEKGGFGVSSHTLYRGWPSLFVKLPVLTLWTYFFSRIFRRDPLFALSALLAISTFFQNLSNDYNLITAYPFLFLVLLRLLRRGMDWKDLGILILTFQAFVGDRTLVEGLLDTRGALFTQIIWFVAFPFYALNRIDKSAWPDGNLPYDEKSIYHRN